MYKDSWEIEIGEVLKLQHELKNPQEKNAVAELCEKWRSSWLCTKGTSKHKARDMDHSSFSQ